LGKFRDNDVKWRENVQRLEKDIPKGAVIYTVQGGETERGKLRVWKERFRVDGTVERKVIIIIIIIIIIISISALQK